MLNKWERRSNRTSIPEFIKKNYYSLHLRIVFTVYMYPWLYCICSANAPILSLINLKGKLKIAHNILLGY